MESAACRRRASDADQSARWSYSATAEREPAMVKEEPEWGECGASEAAVAEGLYAGHEVKDELVIGPELIQQQDDAFLMQLPVCRLEGPFHLKQEGDTDAAPDCSHTCPGERPLGNASPEQQLGLTSCFVRLERLPAAALRSMQASPSAGALPRSREQGHSPCSLPTPLACHEQDTLNRKAVAPCKLKPAGGAPTRPGEGPRCNTSHEQQFELRGCSVRLERILMEHAPTCSTCLVIFHCESSLQEHSCTHPVAESKIGEEIATHHVETGIKRLLQYSSRDARISTKVRSCSDNIPILLCQNQSVESSDIDEKPFSCDMCKSRFALKKYLTAHIRTHTSEKCFSCDVCKSRFAYRSSLAIHRQSHTGEKPFSCDICKSRFTRISSLNVHKRSHTGERPFSCDVCKSQFTYKSNLNSHKRTHTGEKPFSCDICKSRFSRVSGLNEHKRTHTGERPFSCDICKLQFTFKSNLTNHKRTHTGEKPFSCDFCESRFSDRSTLDGHRRTHTGEKPFSCDLCKSRFSRARNLSLHKRTHTGEKPFSCDVCKAYFSYKSTLTSHKQTHTGEKPFACDVCKAYFSYKSTLTSHKRTHAGEKPFACDVCKRRFAYSSNLSTHRRIHTREKPF